MVVNGHVLYRIVVWKVNGHYQAVAYWKNEVGEERLTFANSENPVRATTICIEAAEHGHFRKPNRI